MKDDCQPYGNKVAIGLGPPYKEIQQYQYNMQVLLCAIKALYADAAALQAAGTGLRPACRHICKGTSARFFERDAQIVHDANNFQPEIRGPSLTSSLDIHSCVVLSTCTNRSLDMANQLCRPCRDLARRQLRALIELNQAPRASVAEITKRSRRQFHQSVARREQKPQSATEPSGFAKVLTGIASAVLPRKAIQPYAIFGATEAIFKACSAPASYKISEELRKKEDVPMTEEGEEVGVGGGVWHDGSS